MLVFRNQTSYNRFWDGRNSLNTINTSIRNLTRTILTHAYNPGDTLTIAEKQDVERIIRILMAFPYSVKHHLRSEWGAAWASSDNGISARSEHAGAICAFNPEFDSLLPAGLEGHEDDGLGLPLQLTFFVDSFLKRG